MLLAGDIGGTKTVLALFSPEEGPHHPLQKRTFASRQYQALDDIVADYIAGHDVVLEGAAFGVAGPVRQGRVQVTNLPWVVDKRRLGQTLNGAPVNLLNDLEAVANAIPILDRNDLAGLNEGQPDPEGAIAVIAPGTGLGEAYLVWQGDDYRAFPSEGGHADFAPTTELEIALLRHLMARYGRVSYERVCSGIGIPNIYHCLREMGHAPETPAIAQAIAQATDPTPLIFQAALEGKCDLCQATMELFISVLGAEAGNLALKIFSTGGVYLGGGIPPRILPQLQGGAFMDAFSNKGRFANLLSSMPVQVILNPKAALYGAARRAINLARNNRK